MFVEMFKVTEEEVLKSYIFLFPPKMRLCFDDKWVQNVSKCVATLITI